MAKRPDAHGWIGTETLRTASASFAFRGGYPDKDTAARLDDALGFNRAIGVYLDQMPAASVYAIRKGGYAAGVRQSNQLIIWESLMDSKTLLLTGNSETVYAINFLDLERDGPTVIETPPGLLGGLSD